jgi:flagellar operon protein
VLLVESKSPLTSGLANIGGPASSTGVSNKPGKEEIKSDGAGAPSFGELLNNKVGEKSKPSAQAPTDKKFELKFSQHALERMSSRGISLKPEDLVRLNDAVDKAAQKGSRETLVLMGENALIVSVKNKTVVTAMDREAMKENVFTNIDSTVIL